MKSFKRPNADPNDAPVWRHARGYFGVRLGKHRNPNLTLFRKTPKVRGKAAVKAAKRARQAATTRVPLAA
jgi:hypothetical protein